MAKKKKKKIKNKEKLQVFWAFNAINIITTIGIIAYVLCYFSKPFPTEAYNVGVFALIQSIASFVLNLIVYKNIK